MKQDATFFDLAEWAKKLDLQSLRVDVGETFQNRFVLIWHDRQGCFDPADDETDEYQSFWQDFARAVCEAGPRVDDTLHLFRQAESGEATFWVVGGDGRLASHCANGLLYVGLRWQGVWGGSLVRLQCGPDVRNVEMLASAVRVNLGRPQMLDQGRLQLPMLRNSPLCVDTGEPHAVSFVDDVIDVDDPFGTGFVSLGQRICESWSEAGVNWNLVEVTPEGLRIRTFERGVRRPTSSCGTGSAAAFFAACTTGRWPGPEGNVISFGGTHRVAIRDDEVWLQGTPAHHQTCLLGELLAQES